MNFDCYIPDNYKEAAVLGADLVNTLGSVQGREYLPDTDALSEFLAGHGIEPPEPPAEADLEELRVLRARLKEMFYAEDEAEMARLLNELLGDYRARPRLTGGPGDWTLVHASGGCSLTQSIATAVGVAVSDLLIESGRSRIGFCGADDCLDVFIDTSRNRSRRYCDDSCSSRTNVKAFRARQHSHAR